MNINHLFPLFSAAIIFGFSNGLAPGPALALVISHTLHHNFKEGVKVASGPIIFGAIVAPISIFFFFKMNHLKMMMGCISIIGAIYIAYLGLKEIFIKTDAMNFSPSKAHSFQTGVLANFSSPYAYMFWFTVGAPFITKHANSNIYLAISFVIVYYLCLVGSKILVAMMVEKFRSFITVGYHYIVRGLGAILLIFSVITFKDGILFFY